MRKLYSRIAKCFGMALLLGSSLNAFAAATQETVQLNSEFTLNQGFCAVFVPTTSGTLTANYSPGQVVSIGNPVSSLYTSVTPNGDTWYVTAANRYTTGWAYEKSGSNVVKEQWDVIGGNTYYLYINTTTDQATILSMESGEVTDPKENAIEVSLNGNTTLGGDDIVGTFTITEAGILTVTASSNPYNVAPAVTGAFIKNADDEGMPSVPGGVSQTGWYQDVATGTYSATWENLPSGTYYVYYDSETTNSFTFDFVANSSIVVTLTEVTPFAPGVILDTKQTQLGNGIKFTFSPAGTQVASASITYVEGGQTKTASLTPEDVKGGSWNIGGSDGEIYHIVEVADKDTEITITLNGVSYNGKNLEATAIENNNITINNGTLTAKYLSLPSQALTLLNEVWPEVIGSYMNPGSENGYATLTFSYPMDNVSAELLFYSNYPLGGMVEVPGQVSIPVIINENVATLNFTGIDFTKVEGYTPLSSYSVIVQGMKSTNGLKCDTFVHDVAYNASEGETPATEMTTKATLLDPAAAEVEEAQDIIVTWDYAPILLTSDFGYANLIIDSGAPWTCEISLEKVEVEGAMPEAANALLISLPEGLEPTAGVYNFTLPAGFVKNSETNEVNAEQTFTYTVIAVEEPDGDGDDTDGISSIEAAIQDGAVYNLQGVKVNPNNLKKGIYIINGKKVLVK